MKTGFIRNQSTNNTDTAIEMYGDNASPAFVSLSIFCSVWIIITNVFVLICFVKHRKVMIKSTFSIQILALSCNDLMVGISTLPVYAAFITSEVTYEFCIFRLVLFLSAQVVVLCHIFGICVYRFLTVCQVTLPLRRRIQGRLHVIYELVIWIVTLIILISTFLIWSRYRHTLGICSLNEIFQNNHKTITIFMFCLFTVPAVLTNVIYLAMVARLCFYARKIAPVNSNNMSVPQPSSSNHINSFNFLASSKNDCKKRDGVAHNGQSCINVAGEGKVSSSCNQQKRDIWTNKSPHSKATKDVKTSSDNEGEGKNGGRSELNSMPSCKSQRQAFVTIGLVLGLFDISVAPTLVLTAVEAYSDTEVSRNWKILAMTILTLNSAINPVIYTWKIDSFKKATRKIFQSMCCRICCWW